MFQRLKKKIEKWKDERENREALEGLRIVQIVVDGAGNDATLLALSKSGRIYRTQVWEDGWEWQEMETPASELEDFFEAIAESEATHEED